MISVDIDDFVDQLVVTNQQLTGNCTSKTNIDKVKGCFASYHYYDTVQQQIASIVQGLIKNHCFTDGNKRTALVALDTLCIINKQKRLDDNQIDQIIVDIASHKYTADQVAKLLFPSTVE